MVWLTRFDGTRFILNADLIEHAEATPDTVITLTNGHHFVVREGVDDLVQLVVRFRRRIHLVQQGALCDVASSGDGPLHTPPAEKTLGLDGQL